MGFPPRRPIFAALGGVSFCSLTVSVNPGIVVSASCRELRECGAIDEPEGPGFPSGRLV
jgi:hypothetical protein